jgi:hypothetical protein
MLGLVEIPALFGANDPEDPWGLEDPEAAARLRLERREFDYEAGVASVYGLSSGWLNLWFYSRGC